MIRPPVMTHSATALLCSLALLSGCGGSSSSSVAANDGNATATPATTSTTPSTTNPTSNPTTQAATVAGKAYLRSDGTGMVVFDAGGTATLYSANAGSTVLTWALDGNTLTLATANGTQRLTLAGDGKAFADSSLRYVLPQAVTQPQLAGQQLIETPAPCCSRSWTFKAGEVDVFAKQGSGGGSYTLKLSTVAGMSGVLSVQGLDVFGSDASGWLAWLDGEVDKSSRWVYVRGGRLELLTVKNAAASSTVTPNTAPVATSDTATTTAGTAVTINVLANDTDVDGNPLTIASFSQGKNGIVTKSGNNLIYTPKSGYSGTDTFTYRIMDGHGGESTGTVNITIDTPPVVVQPLVPEITKTFNVIDLKFDPQQVLGAIATISTAGAENVFLENKTWPVQNGTFYIDGLQPTTTYTVTIKSSSDKILYSQPITTRANDSTVDTGGGVVDPNGH